MYIKSMGLFCLLVSNFVFASDLYKTQLVLSNKTSNLHISFPHREGYPVGPTDATIVDNKFIVLDTFGSGVSFFDINGAFLKRVSLPETIQFQNIVRDRDNSLFNLT